MSEMDRYTRLVALEKGRFNRFAFVTSSTLTPCNVMSGAAAVQGGRKTGPVSNPGPRLSLVHSLLHGPLAPWPVCADTARSPPRRHATSHNHTFVSVTSLFIAYRAVSLSASIFCRRRIISPFLSLRIITADGVSEGGKVTLPETFIRANSIILNVSSFSFVIYIIMVFEHLRRQQINFKDWKD